MKYLLLSILLLPLSVVAEPYIQKYDTEEALAFIRQCESSSNPNAYNPADPVTESIGLYQFKRETFNHFGERYGLEHSDIWNPNEQHEIAKSMLEEGRSEHWQICHSLFLNYLN